MSHFEKLFEAGNIGNLQVKNRIILAPMVTRYVSQEGLVTDQLIRYYVERARGGAGLVVTEAAYPRSIGYPGRICLNTDGVLPSLKRLVQAIHREETAIICEINVHRGRADEFDPASASPIPHPITRIIPRVLSIDDIQNLIDDFGKGVRRVRDAGFDGIMIHGGTGYLVAEFLSPLINRRTDQYGTDLNGRARFLLELIDTAKETAGDAYPVMVRLVADDKIPGGFGPVEAIQLCKMLQNHGVDALDITAGSAESFEWVIPPYYMPQACNVNLAEAIKRELGVTVSVAGRINDPYIAEEVLEAEKADFVDMGRALLADPFLPRKAKEGRIHDIRRCLSCQRCIEIMAMQLKPLKCTVNPMVGREQEFGLALKIPSKKKRVLVVGGGPAGMEAGIIAAKRGHSVTIWEAGEKLGGQLNVACKPPGKEDLRVFNDYLQRQLQRLYVTVELKKKVTVVEVQRFRPDAVIIATGSIPYVPKIPGITGDKVVTCRQILSAEKSTGKEVVIIGGGLIGCELADFLSQRGKNVILAFPEAAPMALEVVDQNIKKVLLNRLESSGVLIKSGISCFSEVTNEGVRIIEESGDELFMKANTVVLATGSIPNRDLAESLKGEGLNILEIGDCVESRRILEAVHEGANVALGI